MSTEPMTLPRNPFRRFLPALSGLIFLVLACHLTEQGTVENKLSFGQRFDSLKLYDSLVIEVRKPDGTPIATIFHSKPADDGDLEGLDVPGWDGGPIRIVISGYRNGSPDPVYKEEKDYDGRTDETGKTIIIVHPHPTLSADALELSLAEGQRMPLPRVDVSPANLADPDLRWSSENPGIAAIDGGNLVGISAGSARVIVKLGQDTSRSLAFTVRVGADGRVPDRLILDADTLHLAQNGDAKRFGFRVEPPSASSEVTWRIADPEVASLLPDGSFQGLKPGLTRVWIASKLKPSIESAGWISVREPVAVASVEFRVDSLILYMGGTPESLAVEVLPALANPAVRFTLSDSTKASLSGSFLAPKAPGYLTVTVSSEEDPSKTDLLPVAVRAPIVIASVKTELESVTLYTGAPGRALSASVLPDNAPQGIRWKSLSPAIVSAEAGTGRIEPLQPGMAWVVATSLADSAKRDTVEVLVKTDAPKLTAGPDTLISAGGTAYFRITAVQEFGQIVHFAWDLDGNLAWDDSLSGPWTGASVELPPQWRKYDSSGQVIARFRVRDSEGNAATAVRTVRVANGAAVSIEFPKDNSFTNQKTIRVDWSVNGKAQDSLRSETLAAIGPNTITRSARDSAGKVQTASVTVHLDTTAPLKPNLGGTSPTNAKPKWIWSAGGNGGSGEFRYRLADADFPADAPATRDTAYTLPENPVSGTTYTLFVQERDLAGNWSPAASFPIRYDVTSPVVSISAPQPSGTYYTSTASVSLAGTASGPVAISKVTYRVGTGAVANATFSAGNWSTAAIALQEGVPAVVTVTASDQAGNTGEASITILHDATVPGAPAITTAPAASVPALKGTFGWTAGTDGAGGSGLNGRYRYSINAGAWKDTIATLLVDLPLADGNNVFAVQEQDKAGNWSASAMKTVRADTAGPVITLTSHANPYNSASLAITLSGQVKDTGTGVAAMTVAGQTSGSGTVTVAAGTWTTAALTLKAGANTLLFTATDQVGNGRTLSVAVNVNIPAPVVVITNPADSLTVTRADSITVTYTLDGGAAQTKTFTLIEGVNRLVVASPPNASGNIGRDTVKVVRDATPPLSPNLSRGASPTNGSATWTWTSRGDNTGGAGVRVPAQFRYSMDAGATWTQTGAGSFQYATEGTWALIVQEQDKAGNWSASSASQTITVDKTAPTVTISGVRANYVTSLASVPFSYKVDNGPAKDTTCDLTVLDGANTCSAKSTDNANNTGTASVTVYRRSNVVFVTVAGAGNGSGTSWENAQSAIDFAGAVKDEAYSGKEFWVGKGTYDNYMQAAFPMAIYGGFDAAKTPYDRTNRDPLGTRAGQYFFAGHSSELPGMKFTLDGFVLETFGSNNIDATLTNVTLSPTTSWTYGMEMLGGSKVTANNLVVTGKTYGSSVINIEGTFNMVGGAITNNTSDYAIVGISGTMNMSNGAVISGNTSQREFPYQVHLYSGTLTIGSGVNFSCSSVQNDGGTCK